MSSCQCCLKPHPLRLLERYHSSIQTIKLLEKNCAIFDNLLLENYEQFERISSNLNKYLIQYGSISTLPVFSYCSQLIRQLNNRLDRLTKFIYEIECLIMKCSMWLKNNSTKKLRTQLKSSRKEFHTLEKFANQHPHLVDYPKNFNRKFWTDFASFQTKYQQQSNQMDSIEYEHLKLFFDGYRVFSSIISLETNENFLSTIDIEQMIREWKDKNQCHISWLPNEHQTIEKFSSDIDIKPIDDHSSEDTIAYATNLSWSFTVPTEELSIASPSTDNSNTTTTKPINRVRLAIEAIERNTEHFPRGRKS